MIVPLKKVTLYALTEDREALLVALQQCGKLMISSTEDSLPQEGCEESRQADRLSDARPLVADLVHEGFDRLGFLVDVHSGFGVGPSAHLAILTVRTGDMVN